MRRHLCLGFFFVCFFAAAHSEPEETFVPIYEIFDQGQTEWCWAYSTFHGLRTYFTSYVEGNGAGEWRDTLAKLDSAAAFKEHMGKYFSPTKTGDPQDFVAHMRRENQLPDPRWKAYYPSGKVSDRSRRAGPGAEHRLSAKEILRKAHEGLLHGKPAVYCNPPHCVLLFGDTHENGEPTQFTFADSDGGRVYKWTAQKTEDELDLLFLPEALRDR